MADYKGVLVDLRARKAAIEKERIDLETAIAAIERLASSASNSGGADSVSSGIPARTFTNMTMPQAIEKYFNRLSVREPQTTRQLMDALRAGGLKSKGDIRAHVYNTMHRLSQDGGPYRHEPDGRWSLRVWTEASSAGAFSSIPSPE